MTTLTFRQPAPSASRFKPGCFDSTIGSRVPLRIMGRFIDDCLIVSACVTENGSAVLLTVDIPDEAAPEAPIPPRSLYLLG